MVLAPTLSLLSPGGAVFNPSQLPGLAAWFSADYGVLTSVSPDVPATEGQTVRRWLDRSGNGRHLDQAVLANQPVLNGQAVVSDGVNDTMFVEFSTIPQPVSGYVVFKWQTDPAQNDRVFNSRSSTTFALNALGGTSGAIRFFAGVTIGGAAFPPADFGVANIVSNGASSLVRGSGAPLTGNAGTDGLALGLTLFGAPTSNYADVAVKEVIFYAALHDETTQSKLRQYLARKWGISL